MLQTNLRKKIGVELREDKIIIANEDIVEEYILEGEDYYKELKECIGSFSGLINAKFLGINFSIPFNEEYTMNKNFVMPEIEESLLNKSILYEVQNSTDEDIGLYKNKWIANDFGSTFCYLLKKEFIDKLLEFNNVFWKVDKIEPQIASMWDEVEEDSIVIDIRKNKIITYYYRDIPIVAKELMIDDTGDLENIGELILQEVREIELEHGTFVEKVYLIDNVFDKEEEKYEEKVDENTLLISDIEIEEVKNKHEELKEIISTKLMLDILEIETFESFAELVLRENDFDMNFVTKRKKSDYITSFLLVTTAALLVLNIGLHFIENKYEKTISESINHKVSIEENLSQLNNQEMQLNSEIERYQEDIDMVNGIKDSKVWLSKILYVLSDETPDGVAVRNINVNKDITEIKGYAKDYINIGFLSLALEKHGIVEIEQMDLESDDVTIGGKPATKNFTITLRGSRNYEY